MCGIAVYCKGSVIVSYNTVQIDNDCYVCQLLGCVQTLIISALHSAAWQERLPLVSLQREEGEEAVKVAFDASYASSLAQASRS